MFVGNLTAKLFSSRNKKPVKVDRKKDVAKWMAKKFLGYNRPKHIHVFERPNQSSDQIQSRMFCKAYKLMFADVHLLI